MSFMEALPKWISKNFSENARSRRWEERGWKPPTRDLTEDERKQVRKQLRGNLLVIGLWGLVVIVPMVFLPALLLGLTFGRPTSDAPSSTSDFAFNVSETSNSSDSYFVRMNATTLLTISSWSSTLTPLLGALLMYLWSYRVAASLSKHSQNSNKMGLPSPYQLALILEMIKGNVTTLLQDLKYIFRWQRRKAALVPLLKSSMLTLTTVSLLGLLILLADTWLHLGTEAVTISRSFTMPGVSEESDDRRLEAFVPEGLDRQRVLEIKDAMYDKGSFSGPGWPGSWSIRVPNATCGGATDVDRLGLPCGLDVSGRQHNRLAQYTDVVHFLANSTSSLAAGVGYRPQITQFDDTGTNSTMVMVVPSDIQQGVNFSVDFTASTYGASTNCTPKMGICDMFAGYQYNFTFDCTKNGSTYNHSATIPEQSTVHENLTLYSDPEYINPMRWNANGFYLGNTSLALPTLDMVNPSYPAIAMASVSLPTYDSAAEILEPLAEALGAVLFCKHTIWNVNYTFLNSSWTIDNVVPSTTAVANMSNIPLMLGSLQTYFDYRVDDVLSEQDPMSLANNFANAYSWASMALLEPNLDSAPVNKIQIRRHLLVTRVPKAPLFCLVVLNLLYAALGLALTIDALRVVRKNRDLVDVQAPLTLPGLTAECFEAVDSVGKKVVASEDLFAEKKGGVGAKIGLRRDGESRYVGDGHEGEEKEEKEEIAGYGWRLTRYDIEEVRQRKRNDDDEGDKQDTRKDNAAVADGLLGPSDPPVRIRNV